jgi:hypothetical protein
MVDFGGKGHEEEGTAKQALVREALESTNERVAEQDSVPVFVPRYERIDERHPDESCEEPP